MLKWALIIIPFIVFLLYIFFNIKSFKWFNNIGKKTLRRIYYLFSLSYIIVFVNYFYKDIVTVNLLSKYTINKAIFNMLCIVVLMSIITILWDILFISCISFNRLAFKDLEMSTENVEEIKISENTDEKNIEVLHTVLSTQISLIAEMEEYINNIEYQEETMYKDLIKKYANTRKSIEISCYDYTNDGILKLKKEHDLDDLKFSAISYSLNTIGVCTPEDTKNDVIYSKINTAIGEYIIVLSSEYLYKFEHIIVQNLVCLFDLYIDIIYKNEIISSIQEN